MREPASSRQPTPATPLPRAESYRSATCGSNPWNGGTVTSSLVVNAPEGSPSTSAEPPDAAPVGDGFGIGPAPPSQPTRRPPTTTSTERQPTLRRSRLVIRGE